MDLIKKLTSKNPKDYETAASHIIDNADFEAFKELVNQDDFLFDFIKKNVANRLENAVNNSNYKNLLNFLLYYSQSYDDFIAKSLAEYADEDLTDSMLELFENGTDSQKAYCAKFFSYVKDSLALESLKKNAYSEFEPLALNCASTLAILGDKDSFEDAVQKLCEGDEFEKLFAVKFLTSYGDKSALNFIFDELKKSSLAENIAAEIPYLTNLSELLNNDRSNALFVINLIIDGLGEVSSLSQIFDFQLYEILESLMNNFGSVEALILLNAKNKFDVLTENDEYIYDEDKNTKNEIFEIKSLLYSINDSELLPLAADELDENSDFVMWAVDLIKNQDKILNLTNSSNPTLVLKALTALKSMNKLESVNIEEILQRIDNENIKAVIKAL